MVCDYDFKVTSLVGGGVGGGGGKGEMGGWRVMVWKISALKKT